MKCDIISALVELYNTLLIDRRFTCSGQHKLVQIVGNQIFGKQLFDWGKKVRTDAIFIVKMVQWLSDWQTNYKQD
jgi:hypothetical protein